LVDGRKNRLEIQFPKEAGASVKIPVTFQYIMYVPNPRAATSVATKMGDFPLRNSVKT
jgi:hypothetical protein